MLFQQVLYLLYNWAGLQECLLISERVACNHYTYKYEICLNIAMCTFVFMVRLKVRLIVYLVSSSGLKDFHYAVFSLLLDTA